MGTPAVQLIIAMDRKDIQYIKTFLDNGGNVDTKYDGNTLLLSAIVRYKTEIATLLVERGANVNAVDSKGYTALTAACNSALPYEFIKLLLEHGANPNAVQPTAGNTALHFAAAAHRGSGTTQEKMNILNLLLQYDVNPNAVNLYGQTPLDLLAIVKDPDALDVADVLIAHGATVKPETAARLRKLKRRVVTPMVECNVPAGETDAMIATEIKNGTVMAVFADETRHGRYWTKEGYKKMMEWNHGKHNPPKNPFTMTAFDPSQTTYCKAKLVPAGAKRTRRRRLRRRKTVRRLK
jgi:ankyrin repeat protein